MTLKDRILRVARAELLAATRRLRRPTQAQPPPLGAEPPPQVAAPVPDEIRRYYANLELPWGASLAEVKAAYRKLVKRYHPDLHYDNPEQADAAHRLTQELRQAYEGLLSYLGKTR